MTDSPTPQVALTRGNSAPYPQIVQQKIIQLVLDSLNSPQSKRAYSRALQTFLAWFHANQPAQGLTRASVQSYRSYLLESGLSPSTVNLRLCAVRRLVVEAVDNGMLDPNLAAGILRIAGAKKHGVRTGNWLTLQQAEQLLGTPDPETLRGKRDRAILAVLIGCGLRREEAARLTLDHIQMREARWVIVDIQGKGNRVRTIPMPSWSKLAIDEWVAEGACDFSSGSVLFRAVQGDRISGDSMTAQSIFDVVKKYAAQADLPAIAPHDLRRTFAKLAHKGKAALEQIQLSLGHASIQTTERYLGVSQDLTDAPCDHLGIKI
jgi:site-specific recombinase XerD